MIVRETRGLAAVHPVAAFPRPASGQGRSRYQNEINWLHIVTLVPYCPATHVERIGVPMTARRTARRGAEASPSLESLAALMRTWREHWDEVGAIQRTLPRAARDRVSSLSGDVETALAQTRHLFALEFAPAAVDALRSRINEA